MSVLKAQIHVPTLKKKLLNRDESFPLFFKENIWK
jgi:hypothetical protein